MQTVRWGVVGVGRFGMIHARAIQSLAGSELAAICTRNAERLAVAAKELGVQRAYLDYRTLLDDPHIDAVSIATHWREHFEIARAALASGKHVLLEKPMAETGQQCRELIVAAEKSAGHFMVGHVCRFDPRVSLARQAIDEGRIGRIVTMHAKRNLPKAPGSLRLDKISPLLGDGVHDADLMMWFAGRAPTKVYGRALRVDNFAYPDVGWAMLQFGDDALGVVETNWRLPPNTPTVIDAVLEVIGTEGKLTIDCSSTGLTVVDAGGPKMLDTAYWPQQYGRTVGALSNELGYFAECVRRNIAPSVITPVEAARAVLVMQAAEQSAASGQAVDFRE